MSAKKHTPDQNSDDDLGLEKSSGGQRQPDALPESEAQRKPETAPNLESKPEPEPRPTTKPKPAAESKPGSKEKEQEGETKTLAEIMKFDLKIRRPRR